MSEPLDFESRDTPFPVALAGMIGLAKALFEGFYGVLGIAIASSVDDSFGAGALVFGIVFLIASILLLQGRRFGYYVTVALSVIGLVGAVVYMFSSGAAVFGGALLIALRMHSSSICCSAGTARASSSDWAPAPGCKPS
jgi:hypothetical protein